MLIARQGRLVLALHRQRIPHPQMCRNQTPLTPQRPFKLQSGFFRLARYEPQLPQPKPRQSMIPIQPKRLLIRAFRLLVPPTRLQRLPQCHMRNRHPRRRLYRRLGHPHRRLILPAHQRHHAHPRQRLRMPRIRRERPLIPLRNLAKAPPLVQHRQTSRHTRPPLRILHAQIHLPPTARFTPQPTALPSP